MSTPPLPIAALLLRARNAKSAKERHDLAYFGWEASVRLAVAAQPPADPSKLAMPSTGDWVSALAADERIFDQKALLAAHELFAEEGLGQKSAPRSTTLPRLLAGLPAYRNAILGHGAVREPSFYERAGDILAAGLETLWTQAALWPDDARLVCVESIEIAPDGGRRARVLELSGTSARVIDPRGSDVPEHVVPKRLYMRNGSTFRTLHPWLLFEAAELRERVLFFNGRGRNARFLDYVGGEQLKGKALATAWPSIEADLDAATLGHSAEEASEPRDASLFGDYQLLGKLGEGGMGVVYLARQTSFGRMVALKRLPRGTDDPIAVARFRREIAALARCEHPNVVKILAAGEAEGQLYYAMEVVEGADLAELSRALDSGTDFEVAISSASARTREARTRESRPSLPTLERPKNGAALPSGATDRIRALAVMFRDAAGAVAHIHDNGIIHRDIKPANLMITNERRVVLMDLGLAAIGDATQSLTRDKHSILGTLRYLPPEQLQRSLLSLDRRADIYSLGATFYELLTGKPFFDGDSEARLIEQVLRQSPTDPRVANPNLPRDLALILTKATDKDPKLRYDDAVALGRDLDAYLEDRPITARPPSIGYLLKLAIRRHRAIAATIMLAIVMAAGGAAWFFVRERRLRAEAEVARDEARISEARSERMLAENLVEQAREALLDQHARRAAALLAEAYPRLPDDLKVRFLAAEAARRFVSARNTLTGHGQFVRTAAFSRGARLIVTASSDYTARLWEAADGTSLATLRGHTDAVLAAAFSPDDASAVTASADRTARIWNVKTGASVATLAGHTDEVIDAVFSPDGQRIVTASRDQTARLWDASTGALIATLAGHTAALRYVAFSPDSQSVVTASADTTARVWDVRTGKVTAVLEGHRKEVESAQFSPDGKLVVTAGDDSTARVWDLATRRQVALLAGHTEDVLFAAFSPDGSRIVTASNDATARVWDARTGELATALAGHTGAVLFARFSPDGGTIVTASRDHSARLWDVRSGTEVATLDEHSADVWDAEFSPAGDLVLTASRDGTARVWRTRSGNQATLLAGHSDRIREVAFSMDGQRVVTASADKTARIWNATTGTLLLTLTGHADGLRSVAFSPDGRLLASAGEDLTVRVWDATTGTQLSSFPAGQGEVKSVVFSPDGRHLLTASADKLARIIDARTGAEVTVFRGHTEQVSAARFSPDGLRVITASGDKTARLWDSRTGKQLRVLEGHTHVVLSATFSRDGRLVLTTGGDTTPRIWDAATGEQVRALEGHEDLVWAGAFSPDGQRIATAGADQTTRIWDVASGVPLAALEGHAKGVTSVVFSPDGSWLVTGSSDNTALIWDVHLETRSPAEFAAAYRVAK